MYSPFSLRRASILLAAMSLLLPTVGSAHEGHRDNMSDAEIVQMEDAASMHGATGIHATGEADDHHSDDMVTAHEHVEQRAAEPQSAQQALDTAVAKNRVASVGDFVGRLHPLATHFPIALLLAAALAELLLAARPALGLERTIRFLTAGGAVGAVIAALLGWFAAGWRLEDRSETLGLHRWNGTVIAGVAVLATWLAFRSQGRTGLRVVLAVLSVALIAQGYLGGEMVLGPNHLGIR
jgi:uncharacterized membrane protein